MERLDTDIVIVTEPKNAEHAEEISAISRVCFSDPWSSDAVAETLRAEQNLVLTARNTEGLAVGFAMASVAAASYTVSFREGREPKLAIAENLPAFKAKEQILITKETKKGSREVDLKPGIYELEFQENTFHMLVDASSAGNIKPIQIIEAFLAEHNEVLQENALFVTREDTFTDIGTEGARKLVPLDDIGHI